jgi:hypothetical protein
LKIPLLAGCQMYQIPFSQGSPFPAAIQSSRGNLICILHENLTLNFWFHAGSGRKRSLIPWLWSPYCGIFNRLYPTPIEEKNATRRRIKISESSIHGFSLCHLIPSSFRTPKLMSKAKPKKHSNSAKNSNRELLSFVKSTCCPWMPVDTFQELNFFSRSRTKHLKNIYVFKLNQKQKRFLWTAPSVGRKGIWYLLMARHW